MRFLVLSVINGKMRLVATYMNIKRLAPHYKISLTSSVLGNAPLVENLLFCEGLIEELRFIVLKKESFVGANVEDIFLTV